METYPQAIRSKCGPTIAHKMDAAELQDSLVLSAEQEELIVRDVWNTQVIHNEPAIEPDLHERVSVRLMRFHSGQGLNVDVSSWYDGEVCQRSTKQKSDKQFVLIRFDDPAVRRRTFWLDLSLLLWISQPWLQVEPADDEAPDDAGAWLDRMFAACLDKANPSQLAFVRKWWIELRRGFVRPYVTPLLVVAQLQAQHEARHFVMTHMQDHSFWSAVNSGSSLEGFGAPKLLLLAVQTTRELGPCFFSTRGVAVAPSSVVPGEFGVFALVLFYPGEVIGFFEGDWLWEVETDRYTATPPWVSSVGRTWRSVESMPNSAAILKYSMHYRNVDTLGGHSQTVSALVDPCHGSETLTLQHVSSLDEPFGMMNEPPISCEANCEVISYVNSTEELGPSRYCLQIVSMLPTLPGEELFIHYGRKYDRDYPVGDACPKLFRDLLVQAPVQREFETTRPSAPPDAPSTSASSSGPRPARKKWSSATFRRAACLDDLPLSIGRKIHEQKRCSLARETKGLGTEEPPDLPDLDDCIYVFLDPPSLSGVGAPYAGWYEATVRDVCRSSGEVVLVWSPGLIGRRIVSTVNLLQLRWLPCITADVVALDRCPNACWAWLARAARSPTDAYADPSSRVFFVRWWAEVRWGLVRVATTPVPVVKALQEQQEARFFAAAADDQEFWDAVGDGTTDLSTLGSPIVAAIEQARSAGATCFLKHGLFVKPSPERSGRARLHTLALLFPQESLGSFSAAWFRGGGNPQADSCEAGTEQPQSRGGARKRTCEKVDSLNGVGVSPPLGTPANCELVDDGDDIVVLVARLPVLPMEELFLRSAGAPSGGGKRSRRACDLDGPDVAEGPLPFDNLSVRAMGFA